MDTILAALVRAAFAVMRAFGSRIGPAIGGFLARTIGPLTATHRIGRDNLAAAFPEKDAAWHRATLREAWDNLGRTACEYVHMDAIWDLNEHGSTENQGRILASRAVMDRFIALREDGRPALLFAAHLANWELPAIAARRHGLESAVLYRTPNNRGVAREVLALRHDSMGELIPAGLAAPVRLANALERGAHVGMLVDQRFGRGPKVDFFGRKAAANPLLAVLAKRFDCPVHGARAIRLPDGKFRIDITPEITLPRDAQGEVDIEAATAVINAVIEGWIREYPGQWLWFHRRWR